MALLNTKSPNIYLVKEGMGDWQSVQATTHSSGFLPSSCLQKRYFSIKGYSLKEQRYDSYIKSALWCTLMKKSPKIIILSKLALKRFYSSKAANQFQKNGEIHPLFISGFSDGEACFSITIVKNKEYKSGWKIKVKFSISLHKKDWVVLEKIKSYLGAGRISKQGSIGVQFCVDSVKDRLVIVNHFNKYPLLTQKKADFILFKNAIEIIERKEHLNTEGLKKIVAIKASVNKGLSDELKSAFRGIISVDRPLITDQMISDPNWLTGFTSAEGSFMIRILNSPNRLLKVQVQLEFNLIQHSIDEQLMRKIAEYFCCGSISFNREACVYRVIKFSDLVEKIIPFFIKYPVVGVKHLDYLDWCKAADIIKENRHLTPEGLEEIRKIKGGMNRVRSII